MTSHCTNIILYDLYQYRFTTIWLVIMRFYSTIFYMTRKFMDLLYNFFYLPVAFSVYSPNHVLLLLFSCTICTWPKCDRILPPPSILVQQNSLGFWSFLNSHLSSDYQQAPWWVLLGFPSSGYGCTTTPMYMCLNL